MESREMEIGRVKQISNMSEEDIARLLDHVQEKKGMSLNNDGVRIQNLKGKKLEEYLKSTLSILKDK